jgi:hypothetical protein
MPASTRAGARLEFRNGRPVILLNGEAVSQAMYFDWICDTDPVPHSKPELWLERNQDFRDSGFHVFAAHVSHWYGHQFNQSWFWTGDGVYPEEPPADSNFSVDRAAPALLEMDPAAKLTVRFTDCVPRAWAEANPDHMQAHFRKNGEAVPCFPQPSLASEKGMRDLSRYIANIIRYCEEQPWAERVFAYLYYPLGEGVPAMNVDGYLFDHAPVMQEAYRRFVQARYGTDEALRAAWDAPEINFATVTVPFDEDWQAARAQGEHWVEASALRRYRDYFLLNRELFLRGYRTLIHAANDARRRRPVLFGIDMCKQPLMGWQIRLAFDGTGPGAEFPDILAAAGSIDIGEIIDEPGLDFLVTPADYTARAVGYGYEPEGIHDSLRLRGKTILIENDARTFRPGQEDDTQGAFRDIPECTAGLLRNAAWSITRGAMDYLCVPGGAYYHDETIQREAIAPLAKILDAVPNWPHVETAHAVAMIIDDGACIHEDGTSGYQNLAIMWQRVLGLAHCGIPYRVYLFSDLQRNNMPDYRCYLFPNLYQLNEERLALLQCKIFTGGRMAIFGPSTGITDGTTLSAEWATRLLGVEMELVKKHAPRRVLIGGDSRVARALPASTIYGDSLPYGPILIPVRGAVAAGGAVELGTATAFWGINRSGAFLADRGTHNIAWTSAMPLPANLLRELAREGGCHVWCEDDDVVLASDTVAALHSIKPGPRTLHLPTPRTVWDAISGEKLGEKLTAVDMTITPPDTRLFYFGDEGPY